MARTASVLGGGTVDLDPVAFEAAFNMPLVHETVRAELNARRHGTAVDQDARRGLRRRRQAVAPEGHRPRTGRLLALAGMDGRRHRIRPHPAPLHGQGQPQGAPGGAAQRPVAACRAESLAVFDASTFSGPSTKQAAELLADWGGGLADAGAPDRRRGRRRQVVPQPGPRRRDAGEDAGVADIVGAASLLVSEAALEPLAARAAAESAGGTAEEAA